MAQHALGMHQAEQPILIPFLKDVDGLKYLINPVTMAVLALGLVVLLWHNARARKMVPGGAQNFSEMVLEWIEGLASPLLGKHTATFLPLLNFLFLYNLVGLVPGLLSPTSRLDVNVTLALTVFFLTHIWGIKVKGLKAYLAHFLPPTIDAPPGFVMGILIWAIRIFMLILMPIIHVVGELAKPISLTMRLFGNIMAKEKLLGVLVLLILIFWPISLFTKCLAVVPFVLRSLIVVLGIFISFVQAMVFMLLTIMYIGTAVQEHDEHATHEEEAAHAH
jgi:F-type H+-transporting ATPase subunit a